MKQAFGDFLKGLDYKKTLLWPYISPLRCRARRAKMDETMSEILFAIKEFLILSIINHLSLLYSGSHIPAIIPKVNLIAGQYFKISSISNSKLGF